MKSLNIIALLFVSLVTAYACGSSTPSPESPEPEAASAEAAPAAADAGAPTP
jgi:hypothetical protein